MTTPLHKEFTQKKFNDFMLDNRIDEKHIRILPKSGILMDEEFQPYLFKAVRYLNEVCGLSIKMIQIKAYVEESWSQDDISYLFRVNFEKIKD